MAQKGPQPTSIFAKTWSLKEIPKTLLNVLNQYGYYNQSPKSFRIVLIGKTGSGKSSSGNTILGRKEFQAQFGQELVTRSCQKADGEVDGRPVTVVDTPDLFDTTLSNDEVCKEMIKCISLLAPGPHVFLLVVNIGRFMEEEEKMRIKQIKEAFGGNAEKFIIVLLTGGDQLKQDNMTIDEYIESKCADSFKKLIADCGGRYHLFDNHDDKNQTQVSELITKIDEMVKENGGSYYTNEMLQEAEAVKKEMEKLLKQKEDEMRKEMEELKMKHVEEMKAMRKEMEDLKKTCEEDALQKTQALLEVKKRQKKYRGVIGDMEKRVTKKRGHLSKMISLLDKQDEEIMLENTEEGIKVLKEKHDKEIFDLLEKLSTEEDKWCFCVQRAVSHWMHFPCIIAACMHVFILACMLFIFNIFFINY